MKVAIEAEGLRFAYPPRAGGDSAPWVLDGLDFRLGPGEWVTVMGPNDAGKTTLCLLVAGLAPNLTGGTLAGRVVVSGRDTREFPPPSQADTIGLLFQEPEAQVFSPTVEAEIAWGLENLGLPRSEMQARLDLALAQFGLQAMRRRAPGQLSGGEVKRLALACVLAMRPGVLILDEPMGGLDPVGRNSLLDALAALRSPNQEHRVTILMTESDPDAAAAFSDRVIVLSQGKIALDGEPRSVFQQVDRLQSLGVAVPQMARVASTLHRQLGTDLHFATVDEGKAVLGALLARSAAAPRSPSGQGKIWGDHVPAARLAICTGDEQGRHAAPAAASGPNAIQQGAGESLPPLAPRGKPESALEAAGLWFWYGEESPVLKGIDLAIPGSQFIAVVGANGSGKTTLVKHFNGLLRPRKGLVRVYGQDASGTPIGELSRQVGYLFQRPEQQIFAASVRQELAFGPQNLGVPAAEAERRVAVALERFALTEVSEQPPAILSYGLRRRITLASLATMETPVLILDEPTVGLDYHGRSELLRWLVELHGQGRTIVLVTHDMELVAEHAQRVVVLQEGMVSADCTPEDLFGNQDLLATAALRPPSVVALGQALGSYGLTDTGLTVDSFCARYLARLGRQP